MGIDLGNCTNGLGVVDAQGGSRRPAVCIRDGLSSDVPFLREMLFEAYYWNPRGVRPSLELFTSEPECEKLLGGWGREGDVAVIAEQQGTPAGAAWFRLWTAEIHSYGYVDEATPEVGIAVRRQHRGQGIGRALLEALLLRARAAGFEALSLSVDDANFARHLYESMGFQRAGSSGTSSTYRCALRGPEARSSLGIGAQRG
jgi:GNAT superfamily N-acetyltransferase